VTRKITAGVALFWPANPPSCAWAIWKRNATWGHAREYVVAMWADAPSRASPMITVVATGECHSCAIRRTWAVFPRGPGLRLYVKPDPDLYRPAEVNLLQGDAAKARRVLGLEPPHRLRSTGPGRW